ncbi:MAG TPA: hypothetical protein VMC80_02970 [Patescibacteria group bacterium]|nr:hypothetical protein [Patescibacteria group bacterium]
MDEKSLIGRFANDVKTLLIAGTLTFKSSTRKFFYYLSQRKLDDSFPAQEIHPLYPEVTSRQEAMEYWLEENDKLFQEHEARATREELDELRNSYGPEKIQVLRRIKRRLGQI